jgi:hypothetical protein
MSDGSSPTLWHIQFSTAHGKARSVGISSEGARKEDIRILREVALGNDPGGAFCTDYQKDMESGHQREKG